MSHLTFAHVICLSLRWHSAAITMAIVCAVNEMIIIIITLRKKTATIATWQNLLTVTVSDCCSALRLNFLMSTDGRFIWGFYTFDITVKVCTSVQILFMPDSTGCTARIACGSTACSLCHQNSRKLATMCNWLIELIDSSRLCVSWSHPVTIDCQCIRLWWGRMHLPICHHLLPCFNQLLSLAHCHHCLSVHCCNLHFRLPY